MSNQRKCYVATCQLTRGLHLFASYSFQCVATALVVVYSTDSSSRSIAIEAGRLLSAFRSYHAVGLGASVPRRGPWCVSAAPWAMARQNLPHHRSAPWSSPRHPPCRATMHGVAQAFRRAREIGVAKSVSFGKNKTVLDLKLVYKKC